jgi:hypothetical protein
MCIRRCNRTTQSQLKPVAITVSHGPSQALSMTSRQLYILFPVHLLKINGRLTDRANRAVNVNVFNRLEPGWQSNITLVRSLLLLSTLRRI